MAVCLSLLDVILFSMFIGLYMLLLLAMQNLSVVGKSNHYGKTNFVEHRTFLHLYHSFHRLWMFLFMMFQVSND